MYPDVKIEWIFHHNPDLILYGEDGSQEKSIDLANYNYEQLHELFKTHFRTKVQQHTSHVHVHVPHTCLAPRRALHVPRTCLTRASHVPCTCLARASRVPHGAETPSERQRLPRCRRWSAVVAFMP